MHENSGTGGTDTHVLVESPTHSLESSNLARCQRGGWSRCFRYPTTVLKNLPVLRGVARARGAGVSPPPIPTAAQRGGKTTPSGMAARGESPAVQDRPFAGSKAPGDASPRPSCIPSRSGPVASSLRTEARSRKAASRPPQQHPRQAMVAAALAAAPAVPSSPSNGMCSSDGECHDPLTPLGVHRRDIAAAAWFLRTSLLMWARAGDVCPAMSLG